MKKTEFLTKVALKAKRPDWVKQLTSLVFWITSVAAILMNTVTDIDPEIKRQVNEWVIAINTIVKLGSHGSGEVLK